MSFNYTCPYCGQPTTITDPNTDQGSIDLNLEKPLNRGDLNVLLLSYKAITCPNKDCKKMSLSLELYNKYFEFSQKKYKQLIHRNLLPESTAKFLPDYIPDPIKTDYYEACRIKDLSPKASATLSRRCLQGMIRNFHGITKDKLADAIKALEGVVDTDVWDAIDAVRSVGNIGAHMEKDINYIIDVDPDEAQSLIELIELLIDEWYIARKIRQDKVTKVKAIGEQKKAEKKQQNTQEKPE